MSGLIAVVAASCVTADVPTLKGTWDGDTPSLPNNLLPHNPQLGYVL